MPSTHQKYITLTLQLAQKAQGQTSPNPMVGAVLVKNNKIISTGYHRRAGEDHAEIAAIKKAKSKAKGATLYVNLEPCSTFGKTPPCTDAIIKSGIKEVVIAMLDPNPRHKGRGVRILQKNNIKVTTGVLRKKAKSINQPFIKFTTKKLPYITYKTGQSLDGRIATKTGDSKWVTSSASRDYSHKMRDNFDAIMVGMNTVLKDNPKLSLNKKIVHKKFYKIIIDTELKISPKANLFKDIKKFPVVIATSKEALVEQAGKAEMLCRKFNTSYSKTLPLTPSAGGGTRGKTISACQNLIIIAVDKTKDKLLNLKDLLRKLAKMEMTNILVEGGGQLAGSLFDQKLVDKVMFFVAPKIVGGKDAVLSVQGDGIDKMQNAKILKNIEIKKIGEDLLVEGLVNEY
ncbi:MAG: bifunctional diaminohydroxyphosphoribosylaminopyrimidine deaminase/5-amino-6-(5-phosphoribosylamino)uracil reductase RibD [bacterium]